MYRGLSEFTKGGYEKAAKRFNPKDLEVDLSDKSFIVTGMASYI
jgi:dehydrogenase/reductase SDR family protein 12